MMLEPLKKEEVEGLLANKTNFALVNDKDEVLIVFKKPGKLENKRYRTELENGTSSSVANQDLMLDCVLAPKREVLQAAIDEDFILYGLVLTQFLEKLTKPYMGLKIK